MFGLIVVCKAFPFPFFSNTIAVILLERFNGVKYNLMSKFRLLQSENVQEKEEVKRVKDIPTIKITPMMNVALFITLASLRSVVYWYESSFFPNLTRK